MRTYEIRTDVEELFRRWQMLRTTAGEVITIGASIVQNPQQITEKDLYVWFRDVINKKIQLEKELSQLLCDVMDYITGSE